MKWINRLLCLFSPKWTEVARGPLTQHLTFKGVKVGEQQATAIVEINRCGDVRYLVDEGDGYRYPMPADRFWNDEDLQKPLQ